MRLKTLGKVLIARVSTLPQKRFPFICLVDYGRCSVYRMPNQYIPFARQ